MDEEQLRALARQKIIDAAPRALEAMVKLALTAESEAVRDEARKDLKKRGFGHLLTDSDEGSSTP